MSIIPTPRLVGLRIQAARKARGWSLREMCDHTDWLEKSRLGNWESGLRMIGLDEAKIVAKLLGVTTEHILCLDDSTLEEAQLVAHFRACDERGKRLLMKTAESEAESSS